VVVVFDLKTLKYISGAQLAYMRSSLIKYVTGKARLVSISRNKLAVVTCSPHVTTPREIPRCLPGGFKQSGDFICLIINAIDLPQLTTSDE
jgi:hypothetical protein